MVSSAAAVGSSSRCGWSPRTPAASTTQSMSPAVPRDISWAASHAALTASPGPPMSVASQAVTATSAPPARRHRATGSMASSRRPARTTARQPPGTSRSAIAAPMSDEPPRSSSDCTAPSAFCTSGEGSAGALLRRMAPEAGPGATVVASSTSRWGACRSEVQFMAQIAVIGAGYVGLTTAVCFSHLGHDVVCADIDEAKVAQLTRGEVPIVEAGLEAMVREGLEGGRLSFVLGAASAARAAEFAYLCVPTPQGDDGSADLTYIEAAAREIGPVLPSEAVVVNKSTVPVGSTRVVERVLGRDDVVVVSNPEFLREGSAVHDFLNPGRIVIGSDDQSAAVRVASLYIGVTAPIIVTDPASAETIKYASNAFLAAKISFVNAIAAVCDAVGADVKDVVLGMGYDSRIGHEFLKPGPGFGGSCLPKDTRALVHIADDAGYSFDLMRGVITVNEDQFQRVAAKIREMAGGSLEGVKVAVWGLTFKARTDDTRESPALRIVSLLTEQGAEVQAYDPAVKGPVAGVVPANDPYSVCEGAGVLAVLTEWDDFRWLDFDKVAGLMETPRVIDARNLLDKPALERRGVSYVGIGR